MFATQARACSTFLVALFVLGIVVTGCNSSSSTTSSPDLDDWMSENNWSAVTEAEAEAFGKKLEQTLSSGDTFDFSDMLNLQGILRYSANDIFSGKEMEGFIQGGMTAETELLRQMSGNNSVKFLNTKPWENGQGIMIRVLEESGGCNFHHWYLAKDSNNKVICVDLYIYMAGQTLSETFRGLLLASLPHIKPSMMDRLSGKSKAFAEQGELLTEFFQLVKTGQGDRVDALFKQLPAELQKEKSIQIQRLVSLANVSDDSYLEAMEDYLAAFPNDPSCKLISLDMLVMKEEFPKASQSLDDLIEMIGEDAHLYALKANINKVDKKLDEAVTAARKAIAIEPGYEFAYWVLLEIFMEQQDFAACADTVQKMSEQFQVTPEQIVADEDWMIPFVESEEYQQLLNR